MKTQISVFGYTLRLVLLSVLIVAAVFAGIMYMALQRSINDWNTLRNQNLQTTIAATIVQNYRVEGSLSPHLLQQVLRPILSPTMFVLVADAERNPLYAFAGGNRIPIEPDSSMDSLLDDLTGVFALPNVLIDGNEIFGYVAAGTLGFASDPLNQRFLRNLGMFLLMGLGLAIGAGLLSAYVLSRMLSSHTQRISGFLARISGGERDIPLPMERVQDFQEILESVQNLQQRLKREEELRRRWARDVAHDLRTPITALKTQFEAIQQGVISPGPERIASLEQEVVRIDQLVTDLRALNSMEEPQTALQFTSVNAAAFLQECIASVRGFADKQQFRVFCELDMITADEHLLHRAVTNILQNAVQHGTDHAPVTVQLSAGAVPDTAVLRVRNQGGVPAEDIPNVFERLYRGEASRTTPGSGLGLSIARAIIRQHGGEISLDSDGIVTEVTLSLPQGKRRGAGRIRTGE
ncbi:MAG: sensor histidine kinase [Spirochaeta sp.]